MKYEANSELAMILPLPVPPGSPDDALRFIDFSDYPSFFSDLRSGFLEELSRGFPLQRMATPAGAPLKVHEVGSFEASFVPGQIDFARLDARFRIAGEVWDKLPEYRDWGFAVFKLKQGKRTVHPMAFEFPRRDGTTLFFPTVHIHHGEVEPEAEFDHRLYCQSGSHLPKEWQESFNERGPQQAGKFMNIKKCLGLVDSDKLVYRLRVVGRYKNQDIGVPD